MTKVFQILEEEKREAIAQAGEEATKRANRLTAIRMLRKAEDIEKIVEYSGLTEAEIEEVSKEMLVEMNNAG